VGGTKTLVGLFETSASRPTALSVGAYPTLEYSDLSAIVDAFVRETAVRFDDVRAACFGVAGPVIGTTAHLTNVPWAIDASEMIERFGIPRVTLLNDLEA